ncbi:hypothetical protein [Nocardioides iriomotensis]|uniref:Uncharacterized protein n=1 Tax=Nocardioides iriomotensis TaxID=715784 RepID=A0A4Q5J4M9_9ACTN|nr:hypothetical protein [Nocardioides iriomotensis]RYU13413.1 hypothetical protein ETU37_06140 [Nocardioides iriomotensis]
MLGRNRDADTTTTTDERARFDDVEDTQVVSRDEAAGVDEEQARRDRFGGINWGAGFFGWLVAIAVSLLLAGIIGAVTAGTEAEEQLIPDATTTELGLAAVLTVGVILAIGYYAGGYVAGRMSRYDGMRQGLAVWLVGVVLTALAVAAGTFFGDRYNVLASVELPSVPMSTDTMTTAGLVMAGLVLLVTLVTAMFGGAVGRHYHARVDKAGW